MLYGRRRKGHSMVEFAIAAGVLIPVFAGTFQFGYSMYTYNLLVSAAGSGARYASARTYRVASGTTDVNKGKAAIRNMVVYGKPSGGTAPVVRGLTTANVDVTYTYSNNIPSAVRVSIINFQVNTLFKTYTFSDKPALTFPYYGRYAPNESEP
jgi:Flp pilus assembly protein TadG